MYVGFLITPCLLYTERLYKARAEDFLLVLNTNLYPNKIIKPIRNATNVYLGADRRLLFTHLWLGQIIDNRNFNILWITFVDFLTLRHIHHFSYILSNEEEKLHVWKKKKHHLCQLECLKYFAVLTTLIQILIEKEAILDNFRLVFVDVNSNFLTSSNILN